MFDLIQRIIKLKMERGLKLSCSHSTAFVIKQFLLVGLFGSGEFVHKRILWVHPGQDLKSNKPTVNGSFLCYYLTKCNSVVLLHPTPTPPPLLKPAKLRICNWFPSPAAPQKAYHHYCQAEDREGSGSKIPDNYLSLVSRTCKKNWGEGMKRRGISKRPVFLFSSCKCAAILQPRRESLAETRISGWGERERGEKKDASLCFSWNKDFLSCRDKTVSVYVYREIISGAEVWETNGSIVL